MATTERDVLESKVLPELQAIASSMGVQGYLRLRKADLIGAIIAKAQGQDSAPQTGSGTRSPRDAGPAEGEPATPAAAPQDAAEPAAVPAGTSEPPPAAPAGDPSPAVAGPAGATGDPGPRPEPPAVTAPGPAEPAATVPPAPAQEPAPVRADPPAPAAATTGGDQPDQAPQEGEQRSAVDVDLAEIIEPTSSRRTRRRRRRGGHDGGQAEERHDGAEPLPGLLDGSGGAVASANGEAPAAEAEARTAEAVPEARVEPDRGPRRDQRDWQGGRWDGPPQQGSGRRNRNRNRRNRNRFPDQGGVAVDRPEYRGNVPDDRPEVVRKGILDIRSQDGYGFIRVNGYLPGADDVYVPLSMIRRLGLRRGDEIEAAVKLPRDSEKYAACSRVDKVNGLDPEETRNRRDFKDLTPLYPQERLRLEHNPTEISTRVMDLMCPIGKGQRGLIVSPPKAGKTTLMKQIANAISDNNPEVYLIILLTDERPEEVTDMQRSTKAEVIYSTFDRPSEDHCQIAELTIERAKRMVEYGRDVMILLDGITRLSRAYNLATPASGKILSGGVDSSALYPPKRFFGAARNIEEGGSLTVLATALVDTGSRMDEVIFEEFKGTGNMEVRLDRKLSERRIFPALDIDASSTRKEELLLDAEELVVAWKLRRVLGALEPAQALELVVDKMRASKTNAQFLRDIQRANIG
ncbi:MAG TPA: transcription termination factor Rho, partial [Actinomycetes bacterium]|nr:transcription termination factor Rho [Actinomycetes bacterium]